MKYMVRLTIKYICYGISWGCTCFVFMCSVWVICSKDSIAAFLLDDFVKHAAGSVLVGLACGDSHRLPIGTAFWNRKGADTLWCRNGRILP